MRMKWLKLMGVLLLCVYAAAIVHQILPHDPGHGNGESCPLCLLLMSVVVFVAGVVVFLQRQLMSRTIVAHTPPYSRTIWSPFSLRGPPSAPF